MDRSGGPEATEPGDGPPPSDLSGGDRTHLSTVQPVLRGGAVLALCAVGWLAATLWSAHATIGPSPDADPLALTRAALALPGVIAASLLAGGATGLALVEAVSRHAGTVAARVPASVAVAVGGGLLVGLLAGGSILLAYGSATSMVIIAVAIVAAAAIGGVPAGLRPAAVVGAGFAGMLAWYAVGLVQGLFSGSLRRLFGAGDTIRSQADATNRLSFAVALLGGVVAGLVAYRYLHRRGERRWPAYLVAGVAPGVLLLLAEVVTVVGGARLLDLAGSLSGYDRFAMRVVGFFRIKTSLVVLFTGGVVTLLAFGRSLPAPERHGGPDEAGARDRGRHDGDTRDAAADARQAGAAATGDDS